MQIPSINGKCKNTGPLIGRFTLLESGIFDHLGAMPKIYLRNINYESKIKYTKKSFDSSMANEGSKATTPELEEELKMRKRAEDRLIKLGSLLEIAESRNMDIPSARLNYDGSRDELYN